MGCDTSSAFITEQIRCLSSRSPRPVNMKLTSVDIRIHKTNNVS